MKRRHKSLMKLTILLPSLIFFCEYAFYYLIIFQCSWPKLEETAEDSSIIPKESEESLKVLFIADTHLIGPIHGHWFDKLRREWQMHRAFKSAIELYKPEVVFILGDLFDEGEWCNQSQFQEYVDRFYSLFELPDGMKMYVVPGNHDMGFHYKIGPFRYDRFNSAFNTTAVQLITIKENHFVLINSMAMEQDGCFLCTKAENLLKRIAKQLNTAKESNPKSKIDHYSRPILLQHFPMYRQSDEVCNEPDEAPEKIKKEKFKQKWDCLSKGASEMIYDSLNPRVIITGHTHHGCHVIHRDDIHEFTVPSFSWRNKNNPNFMLGVFTSNNYSVKKCDIPKESTVIIIYCFGFILIISYILSFVRL